MSCLDGLWWLLWRCAGSITYSPSQLGDHQFQSLRIPTVIGVSLCIAAVCCCLLRIPTAIGMWLINLFPLSVCGLDGSVALTVALPRNGKMTQHHYICKWTGSHEAGSCSQTLQTLKVQQTEACPKPDENTHMLLDCSNPTQSLSDMWF
jgi:hypothetical protein